MARLDFCDNSFILWVLCNKDTDYITKLPDKTETDIIKQLLL